MKSKKGFLLGEETLKIIVAVICIFLLILLLFGLYSVFMKDKKLKQAEESLNNIKLGIEQAKTNGEAEVIVLYPTEGLLIGTATQTYWWILAFPIGVNYPETCKKNGWKYCLCICDAEFSTEGIRQAAQCGKWGRCIESSDYTELLPDKSHISIKNAPVLLKIKYSENRFEITRTNE